MTQEEAGRPLRISKSKLSRIEQGYVPGYNDFLALLDRYGILTSDYAEFVRMFDQAKEQVWWPTNVRNDLGYVGMEASASMVRVYQIGFVPGILQTENYMRTLFTTTRSPNPRDRLEQQVEVRLRRQRRLFEEPLLQAHLIMDESALHRTPCDRAQLEQIIERAALANLTVQVLGSGIPAHDGLHSNYVIVDFPDPEEAGLIYLGTGFGSVHMEKPSEVDAAREHFEYLTGLAFDEHDSIELLKRLVVSA